VYHAYYQLIAIVLRTVTKSQPEPAIGSMRAEGLIYKRLAGTTGPMLPVVITLQNTWGSPEHVVTSNTPAPTRISGVNPEVYLLSQLGLRVYRDSAYKADTLLVD